MPLQVPTGPAPQGPTETDARRAALARLIGERARADVQRALDEVLAGRPVVVRDDADRPRLVLPVDGLTADGLAALRELAGGPLSLVVSATRAAALGQPLGQVATLPLPGDLPVPALLELAAESGARAPGPLCRGDEADEAAAAAELEDAAPVEVGAVEPAGEIDGGVPQHGAVGGGGARLDGLVDGAAGIEGLIDDEAHRRARRLVEGDEAGAQGAGAHVGTGSPRAAQRRARAASRSLAGASA